MLERKNGVINQIVYDNTVYHNGEYRLYPSISSLLGILETIIKSNATTQSFVLIPYYRNKKFNIQLEFDNMSFCVECENNVSEESKNMFLERCCNDGEKINEDIRRRNILCDTKDIEGFKNAICSYIDYLDILVPKMMDEVMNTCGYSVGEIFFGHICFHVASI